MKKPLLSICIPTRNRPNQLLLVVNELSRQVIEYGLSDQIEIVITDNTDVKELVFKGEINKDFTQYISNGGNIGYARNINKLILEARGNYIWFLSDDDAILDGTIKKILECIENCNMEINYLTFEVQELIDDKILIRHPYFGELENSYFLKGEDFLINYWLSVIFLSINVFNREKLISHANHYNLLNEINIQYQNSLLCLSLIDKHGCVKVINQSLVINKYGEKNYSYGGYLYTIKNFSQLISQLNSMNVEDQVINSMNQVLKGKLIGYGIRHIVALLEGQTKFNGTEIFKDIIFYDIALLNRIYALCFYLLLVIMGINISISGLFFRCVILILGKKTIYQSIKLNIIQKGRKRSRIPRTSY